MKTLITLICCTTILFGQQDLLKDKFVESIHKIVRDADAIVGVAIKDLKSGEQIVINEKEIYPQASSIKIHILSEVYKQAAEGKFKMTDIRPLNPSVKVGGSGVLSLLGDRSVSMSIRDYCVLMMHESDNTATNLLIDLVGMKNVNESLVKNGAPQTKLQRVMMDYQAAQEGRENISTPIDVMTILEKLYAGTIVNKQASADMVSIMSLEKNGWIKSGVAPGITVANKAGDVEGVKVDAAIVYLENNPYIITVMTKMLIDDAAGSAIITAVSRTTFNYYERKVNSNQYGRRIPK
jgi:beta-lactamase class A